MAGAAEGGWGWVLVAALFVASGLVFGLLRGLGVVFVELVRDFGESDQAVSWVTSISVAVQQLMSPVGTAASGVYGARPVVMLGGFLSGLGFLLASRATALLHLYLSMGVVTGVGWALVFAPAVASVMRCFGRRRSLAMGVAFSGVGVASFAFSPLLQVLLEAYGWRGALMVLGALSFNIMACGALIRPVAEGVERRACPSVCLRLLEGLELSLLCHRGFLTYTLALTLVNAGYFTPYLYLVAHSRLTGLSEYQAAFLLSGTGVADILGRLASGWASAVGRARLAHLLAAWTACQGLFLLLLPLAGGFTPLLALSLAYGFCAGAMTPLAFAVVPEVVGAERLVGALGLLQLLESAGGLLGAPLAGWLRDRTGTYTASFCAAGGFLLSGALVTTALPRFWSREGRRPEGGADTPGQ